MSEDMMKEFAIFYS